MSDRRPNILLFTTDPAPVEDAFGFATWTAGAPAIGYGRRQVGSLAGDATHGAVHAHGYGGTADAQELGNVAVGQPNKA